MQKPDLEKLLAYMDQERKLVVGTEMYDAMHFYSDEARQIQADLNAGFLTQAEIRRIMMELTGRQIPESFKLFTPFYTDFGKNIHIGENVFFNSGCCFQDQGGIYIGNGCLLGHRATIATINHGLAVRERHVHNLAPVRLGDNVWLGANVTILPGVTVGEGAIIAAGSVVIRDVEPMTIVGGNPARKIKDVPV